MKQWPPTILALTVFVAVVGVVVMLVRDESASLSTAGLAALSSLLTLIVQQIFQADRDAKEKGDE